MIILGIESSCDETGAAIVENGRNLLSNVVASSANLHQKYGGVVPEVAAREQVRVIIPTIEEALDKAKLKPQNLGGLAVVFGPGLLGSLLVGVETAKTLALVWEKPITPVNHLIAHLYANWIGPVNRLLPTVYRPPQFPLIALIVSGSHSDLLFMKGHGKFRWLGGTRDDAAGESFDKVARLIGLAYPGGPAIDKVAKAGNADSISFSRPMLTSGDFDFSFSGIKTEAVRLKEKLGVETSRKQADFAASFQQAIVDVLVSKTIKAAQKYSVKTIVAGGGVAANSLLNKTLKDEGGKKGFAVHIPPPQLSTDNGAIVAAYAFYNWRPVDPLSIQADPSLDF